MTVLNTILTIVFIILSIVITVIILMQEGKSAGLGVLTNYSRDASVIISTHLIEDVEPVLDEAVFLKNGRIFAHRSVDELRETEGMSVDAYFREVFKC